MRLAWLTGATFLTFGCCVGCGSAGEPAPIPATASSGAKAPASSSPPSASVPARVEGAPAPVAVAPPAPKGCVVDVRAGHHTFACDGLQYDVEVSSACASGGCGLVLDVPGWTMDAAQQDRNTGLRARGAARGYVVVQPTAGMGAIGPSFIPETDDAKVWSFVQDARAAFSIDPRRVHVTGFSQGGAMGWRLLCKHADAIASAAPAADASACTFTGTDVPSRKLSILTMAGVRDPFVAVASARSHVEAAVKWLGGSVKEAVSQDVHHARVRFRDAAGNAIEYIEHDYVVPNTPMLLAEAVGGHCCPGSNDFQPTMTSGFVFGCAPPNALVWGDEVMSFFVAHPLP